MRKPVAVLFTGGREGYTHFWEAPVFTYRGKKVRIKGTNFLGSPAAFRYREQIPIEGGSYEKFGTLWFRVRTCQQACRIASKRESSCVEVGSPSLLSG